MAIRGLTGRTPVRVGSALANSAGSWSVSSRKLDLGTYRVYTVATTPAGNTKPKTVLLNMVRLGLTKLLPRPRRQRLKSEG